MELLELYTHRIQARLLTDILEIFETRQKSHSEAYFKRKIIGRFIKRSHSVQNELHTKNYVKKILPEIADADGFGADDFLPRILL